MDVYVGIGIIINDAAGNEVDFLVFLGKIDLEGGEDPGAMAVSAYNVSNGAGVGATDRDREVHFAPSRFVLSNAPTKSGLDGDRSAQKADDIWVGTHASDGIFGGRGPRCCARSKEKET